jgi:predicted ester cyclase
VEATGNRVSYVGVALFTVSAGLIRRAWIVGDTQELWRALGRLGPQPS